MSESPTTEAEQFALTLAQLIDEKQGSDIAILDVSAPLPIADYFVVATARNSRHAAALARALHLTMKQEGIQLRNMAGLEGESGWVLLDFNTVVVHVFSPDAREFYGLETHWADVPRIGFTPAERQSQPDDSWLPEPDDSYPDSIGNV